MPQADNLWVRTKSTGLAPNRFLANATRHVALSSLDRASSLDESIEFFYGKSVAIFCQCQLTAALALIQLDGVVRRLTLCPPDLTTEHLTHAAAEADIDIILSDKPAVPCLPAISQVLCNAALRHTGVEPERQLQTEWLLFTSGTTGRPKQVIHTFHSLTAPLRATLTATPDAVWSTFYDIRRYGGLQILLRALLSGTSMVFSDSKEPIGNFLHYAGTYNVTHISGTPSHWRRALMSTRANKFSPQYIRLSGEAVDQAILDKLHEKFSVSQISHAFASTEAGVAFDVRDGQAGFPASFLKDQNNGVEIKVLNGTLHVRSPCVASGYLGDAHFARDDDGFVDTGDWVEERDGRYYFVGRKEGLINIGGQKVYPEEIETVLNTHPAVQMSFVHGRRSPITGALVVADIVIEPEYKENHTSFDDLKKEIIATCRKCLPPYKVPSKLYEVPVLPLSPAGKLLRHRA